MIKKIRFEWEEIYCAEDGSHQIARSKVIGGWIVKSVTQSLKNKMLSESMVFVQDRDHEWMILPPVKEETAVKKAVSASDFESPK